ncbi:hypothetical protein B0H19DRAFT_272579 [Mycena capillaripes]|nr:hypothetical protein B0H19DRAFT_272579 [Mycena capillaripes]
MTLPDLLSFHFHLCAMSGAIKHEHSSSSESQPARKKKHNEQTAPQTPPRSHYQVQALPDSDDEDLPEALAPKPPTRPKSGRPSHRTRSTRTDAAPAAKLSGLISPDPQTPPSKSKQRNSGTAYSPFTNQLLSFTTAQAIHLQASPTTERTSKTTSHKSGKQRIGLNNLRHRKDKGWASVGRATTFEAYKCFEQWQNDYSPQHYALAECVDIVHAGNPFDRPKDIRARSVMFCWNTPDRRPPAALKDKRVPVFRAKYKCTGHCRHGHSSPQSDDDTDEPDSDDDGSNGSDADEPMVDDLADSGYVEVEDGISADEEEDAAESDTAADPLTDDIASLNKQLNNGAKTKVKSKGLVRHKCKVVLHASRLFFWLPNMLIKHVNRPRSTPITSARCISFNGTLIPKHL